MKFINRQALNVALTANNGTYTPKTDAQIRAFTAFNPTTANIDLIVKIGAQQYIKRTVTPNSTEVINQLFNQQIVTDEVLSVTGTGLNVIVTVVEIVD